MTNQTPLTVEALPETEEAVEPVAPEAAATRRGATVSVEVVAYAALIVLSLTLRLVALGALPLTDREAHEALAAFRVVGPRAVGSTLVAHNPLMLTADTLIMLIFGGETATARMPTVLVGVLLVCSPLLFRRWLGRGNALIMAGLLAISPVLLGASRTMSGAVWSMALAVLAVYLICRFIESGRAPYAIGASAALLMLILASEAAGFLTFLGLAFGLVFALYTIDDPDHRYRRGLFQTLRQWPWIRSVVLGGAAVGLVAMVFMLYPEGLSGIGDVLYRALRGFAERPAGYPFAYPLLTSLVYEPVFWIFGLVGAYMVMSRESDFVRRAMVGWLIASVVWSIIYPGAEAGHALWLTIPLAGLSAVAVQTVMEPVRDRFWNVPIWGPWLHGLAVAATLAIAGINLLAVGRMIQSALPTALPALQRPMQLLMIAPASLLVVITFFLVGSMWGARASWHGVGIGVLVFFGLYSLGAGWRAAVVNADDPRELLHLHPATRDLNLMLTTLNVASLRATGAPYDMAIVVQPPPNEPFDDGALAWMLRKFYHTTFVTELSPTTNAPVVITPKTDQPPKLGAAYVGQDFPVYYAWDRGTLSWDFLTWLYDRDTRVQPSGADRVITWVRSDVYGVAAGSLTPSSSAQ